jgi:hypothetical protein
MLLQMMLEVQKQTQFDELLVAKNVPELQFNVSFRFHDIGNSPEFRALFEEMRRRLQPQ